MAEDKNKKTNNNLKTDKIKALEKQDVGNKETVSNKESEKDSTNCSALCLLNLFVIIAGIILSLYPFYYL